MTTPVPFGQYDFDNDSRWQEFYSRNNAPGQSLAQLKARFYQQEVNPNFVTSGTPSSFADTPVVLSVPSPQSATPITTQPAAVPIANAGVPGNQGGSQGVPQSISQGIPQGVPQGVAQSVPQGVAPGRSSVTSMPGGNVSTAQKVQPYLRQLSAYVLAPAVTFSHGVLVLLFALYLLTMFFKPRLSVFAYRNFLLLAAFNHFGQVFQRFGAPRVLPYRGFQPTLDAFKTWAVPVAATTDLQYAVVCISLLGTRPLLPAIIPMAVLAVFHSSYQLNSHFGSNPLWRQYGLPIHNQLFAQLEFAQLANAGAEIMTGFLLLLLLLTPSRNILQTFLIWQILRVRFWSPDCSACHRQAWRALNERVQPLLDSAPFLKTPIGYVQQWFLSAGQQVATRP